MRNLLSTAAPHQGPGPPGFYLYSLLILVSSVPSFLSNPRLRLGIQNDLVPISNSNVYDYLKVLQELCKLLNNLNDFLLNNEMIDYQQQSMGSVSFDFIYWRLLFYLRLRIELILQLTKVFRRFDPTTIPVHYPNNNNNTVQVPYVQMHATTVSDTGTYNNDADKCNIDVEWYAHVFYDYLEAGVIQENNYYAFQMMYFTKYSNWCDTANKIYALLVIDYVKYLNQLRYRAPRIILCTGTITVCTNTDFITLSIKQVLSVVRFMVFKDIFTIKMFAGKFHYQDIVQVPFRILTFLFKYLFQSCIRSYIDIFSVHTSPVLYVLIWILQR